MAKKGRNTVAPQLGDNAVEDGALVLLRPRKGAMQQQGAMVVPHDLAVELEQLYLSLGSAAARHRWWLSSFGGQNNSRGRCLYRGKHPIVIRRDSKSILS
jgi:hypothetical protein